MTEILLMSPGGASEETLAKILTTLKGVNQVKFDYAGGPSANDPVYIGVAPALAATSDAVWVVRKLSYTGTALADLQTREDMTWDDRATPSPVWH